MEKVDAKAMDAAIRAARASLARKRLMRLFREWVAAGRPRR